METQEYMLQTVVLKNVGTGKRYFPCMMVTTPDGHYVNNTTFTNDTSKHIAIKLKGTSLTYVLYQVSARYEPIKNMDFEPVEVITK